jgi:FtsP/CotA-like multicopper oxidase with cupredoxin domain
MSKTPRKLFGRRSFLRGAGGALALAAGTGVAPPFLRRLLPVGVASAADSYDLFFGGTDGWISLPPSPAISYFHPDSLAPAPFTTYVFGFRNVTGLDSTQMAQQKLRAQHNAPLFWVRQYNPPTVPEFRLALTNLGLGMRPDLTDAHTVHWHGFRNVIPYFDGEPTGSVAVPVGRIFVYVFRPRDPGTYMFHCHVEDVEHVHMGMTSLVFVRPMQDGNVALYPSGKYAYNDGDGSTGFDREFVMFLSEVWAEAHWADAHIQLPEWSDYHPDFSLLNGRVYPDTVAPNAPFKVDASAAHSLNPQTDAVGDLVAPAGRPDLQYQPYSALVTCNAGERVLLRFANLGFREAAMTLAGIKMKVVGKDATPMRGRDGTDTSYLTSSVNFGAGESIDAIFTAPAYQGPGAYDTYVLYNRAFKRSDNLAGADGFGGQRTEIRVYPAGTLPAQTAPNT